MSDEISQNILKEFFYEWVKFKAEKNKILKNGEGFHEAEVIRWVKSWMQWNEILCKNEEKEVFVD